MARPKKSPDITQFDEAPETLENHIFYGLKLDEDQRIFRDAIWSKDYDCIICQARAGSGKSLIAIATAILLCQYGRYSGIIYQSAGGVYESKQGLLPGTIREKSQPLFTPLYQCVLRLGFDPMRLVASDDNMLLAKEGGAMIVAQSDSYIRGTTQGEENAPVIVILDEAQNYTLPAIRTAVTRVGKGSKLIVMGEQKQCDLRYPQDSGFPRMISVFSEVPWTKVCTLTHNYRGRISALGDEL